MQIHITYTGGTIGMVPTPNGLAPGADLRGWLDHIIAGTQLVSGQVSFTQLDPLIDSSNATPENWQAIIDDLRANRDKADAFIVLHGTDTMAYTAAALSYALTDFGKPVILTGSQLPLGRIESDATANVTGALNAALSKQTAGVSVFFGHHLFLGSRVTKRSSWAYEGFDSPQRPRRAPAPPGGGIPSPPKGRGGRIRSRTGGMMWQSSTWCPALRRRAWRHSARHCPKPCWSADTAWATCRRRSPVSRMCSRA